MKNSFKYFTIAALAILLCSCNEDIPHHVIEPQVQISAKIVPCIETRVTEDGTIFTHGDAIRVQNLNRESKGIATYTYSEATRKWSTTEELYWDGKHPNTFNAWYPADAEYASFTIPVDQTQGVANADWMTATTTAKQEDGDVKLSFNHNLTKVTVTIESWSNEYAANERVVDLLELNSLSSVMYYDETLYGDNAENWVKCCVAQQDRSFVVIVAPGEYDADMEIMQVYVNGAETSLKVKTQSALTIESGKAYNFKLSVGKNLATISSSVSVNDWDDEALEDQFTGITDQEKGKDIEYTLSQGYASENTLNNNASHRVKTSFIYGSFSVETNDGYVIRAIYSYPTAAVTSNFTCLIANSEDCTQMQVMNEGRYAIVTFAKASDPNASITPNEDIVRSLTEYQMDIPDYPGVPYINNSVFFGDSIMHGAYSYFETDTDGTILRKNGFDNNSYHYLRIPDYFGFCAGSTVTNNAQRGSGWITDTRGWGNALEMADKTDFSQYDFAAFCFGINDWIQGAEIGSLDEPGNTGKSITEGTVVANMMYCIEKVRRENPECIIVVYSPYISWGQYSDGGDYTSKTFYGDESTNYALGAQNKAGYTLQDLIDVIDEVCRHYDVRHVPLSRSRVCTVDNVKEIMIDGLHPSREYRQQLAEEIFVEGTKDII
ncbi:MAG: fimbrillin family protein [Alistipes sp.]|nr:fimbrillin family protein [Alistipes sp.]